MTPIVYFNGQYSPKDAVRISPEDRGFVFGDGVYEVIRSYDGHLFGLAAHLARLHYGVCELAINAADGRQVGAVWMPAGQSGSPMTYLVDGRQYIVVAVSGGPYSGEYIAYALPGK